MKEEIEKILDNFDVKKKMKSTGSKSGAKSTGSQDKRLEINLRKTLETFFNFSLPKDEKLRKNEEFHYFQMDLFNQKNKELIDSSCFGDDEPYFYIKLDKKELTEYFIIRNDDFSKLFFYNTKNEKEEIRALEESHEISNETTKFFFSGKEESNVENEMFFDDIKLDLISNKTISFIGKNNDIPEDILKNYYVKGRLISRGTSPYFLSFGRDIENKRGEGKFHYPMKSYYAKLTSNKGQFDAAYISSSEIFLDSFKCEIIYQNFKSIPKDCAILFEFENGKTGEKKVITQANKYQNNAKFILKNADFYHIIIIKTTALGDALRNYIDKNKTQISMLKNFAVLCLNDIPKICGTKLEIKDEVLTKTISENQSLNISDNSSKKKSKSSSINSDLMITIQNNFDKMNKEISSLKNYIKSLVVKYHGKDEKSEDSQ